MAISSLTCPPPVRRSDRGSRPDYELLDTAIEQYERGEHAASLASTFAHLFPDLPVPDVGSAPFSFVQGSSRVTVDVVGESLRVRVPLVRLTADSIATAALRFLLSRISATGQLYQPVLHGEEVYLEFTDRLGRLHPHKLREVLRRMPVEADDNDDWMVAEFQCAPLQREPIESLTDEELARCEEIWRTHWDEVDELVKESQRKRSMFFLNEITAYAVHHLQHALPLTGYWWSRIKAAADTFNDTNYGPSARENSLAKCAREMKEIDLDTLRGSLGHAHHVISPLADGTPKVLSDNLGSGNYIDQIVRMHNGGQYMDAAVGLIGTLVYLLARFSWPPKVEGMLVEGLAIASGKPWREATAALLRHADLMFEVLEAEGDGEDADDEHDDDDDDDGPEADDATDPQTAEPQA
jgi:hypothetical protein